MLCSVQGLQRQWQTSIRSCIWAFDAGLPSCQLPEQSSWLGFVVEKCLRTMHATKAKDIPEPCAEDADFPAFLDIVLPKDWQRWPEPPKRCSCSSAGLELLGLHPALCILRSYLRQNVQSAKSDPAAWLSALAGCAQIMMKRGLSGPHRPQTPVDMQDNCQKDQRLQHMQSRQSSTL